ncbi:RNA polymerase sigma factor [Lishizhenia tianjinensis]|nr:sigma-70 family RNA polymerase sigma factor [Lishizhenia tianjinensis]
MEEIDYSDIITRLKQNELKALGELYDGLNHTVYNRCFFILKDEELAKDATHDVFLKAFQKIDTIEDPKRLEAWISRIVYNHCVDYFRVEKKLTEETEDLIYALENEAVYHLPEVDASSEDAERLKEEIDKLNDTERLILVLHYWEGLTVSEIAEYLQLGLSSTKMKLMRTRNKLKFNLTNKNSLNTLLLLIGNAFYF